MSEAELIARARRGDETAWETLVGQHREAVFRLAYLLLGDADEAQDAAQEAFIRAFKALDRFDATRPFRPWLLSIAANLARNRRRALGRYLAALQRMIWADPAAAPGAAAESNLPERAARMLWQAVRRLNFMDQQVIYLRYFLELSEAETASALDIAQGTVKSRLHRALERLRDIIRREFPMLQEEFEA